jgi:hypothetical protein
MDAVTMHALGGAADHVAGLTVWAAESGDKGILDMLGVKAIEVEALLKSVAYTASAAFVIWKAWAARGAIAAVVIAGFAAMIFVYLVNNMKDVQPLVENELEQGLGRPVTVQVGAPTAGGKSPPGEWPAGTGPWPSDVR